MAWNIPNILIEAQKKSGGGGTSDYSELSNKPQINSVTLSGNKSLSDLGIASATDVTDIQDLIPEDAATTNKLATADDLPGLATTSAPGLVQPDGTTVTINDGVITAVGGSNPFSNLTPFFYTKSLKSNLVVRGDGKGYNAEAGATGWSATLTTAQINQLNNSNCVLAKIYANNGSGIQEISDIFILPKSPNQKSWFAYYQSGVNELFWAQLLTVGNFWAPYGSVSNEAYTSMNESDEAFAVEYYILA